MCGHRTAALRSLGVFTPAKQNLALRLLRRRWHPRCPATFCKLCKGRPSHTRTLPPPCPAVLAQLKRRRIMVPSLLRMAYTVGFETLTAQASGCGWAATSWDLRAAGCASLHLWQVQGPYCALLWLHPHPTCNVLIPPTSVNPCPRLPHHTSAQYLFWGPTKKYGVSDSVVDNVRETVLGLAQQLSQLNFRTLHMHAS